MMQKKRDTIKKKPKENKRWLYPSLKKDKLPKKIFQEIDDAIMSGAMDK